jgi:hypothetical protein
LSESGCPGFKDLQDGNFMIQDVNIDNLCSYEVNWNYLEASQQLQLDKQTYGADYIHLYVDDIEGDWLKNWDWEDDLTDYIDAFYHHCQQGNYQFAFDTLMACNDLLKNPENYQKCLEIYNYLIESFKCNNLRDDKINQARISSLAQYCIWLKS